MHNYKLTITYDGTKYKGWQRLKDNDLTIQGKVEDVLSRWLGKEIKIIGASRTDGGVHALGQVANVFLSDPKNPDDIRAYLNQYLPQDIEIVDVQEAGARFHSRLNAKRRTYEYRIGMGGSKHIFERNFIYHLSERLDIDAMKEASKHLIGTHDFQSFCARKMKKSSVRTIESISFEVKNGVLKIFYTGNGFLHHMVRIITGTLIEVGLGERNPESIPELIASKTRSEAGYLVPARGLFLVEIEY